MLAQPAPNMATLLLSLKEVIFENKNHDRNCEERGPIDRDGSFGALTQILYDQAERDGFKLITINTESKRAILACNRQGRPPVSATSPAVDENSGCASNIAPNVKSRAGSSIRCGCRMRVNINYHMKLRGWRITSYEICHNHHYGSSYDQSEAGKVEFEQPTDSFVFTKSDADDAIATYSSRIAAGQVTSRRRASRVDTSAYFDEHDAARMLQALSSSMPSSSNSGSPLRSTSISPYQQKRRSSEAETSTSLRHDDSQQTSIIEETPLEIETSFKELISKARRNAQWIDEVAETIKRLSEKFDVGQADLPHSDNDILDLTDFNAEIMVETSEITNFDQNGDLMPDIMPSPKKQRINVESDTNVNENQLASMIANELQNFPVLLQFDVPQGGFQM